MTIRVAILGFGTVGQGVYQTILTHQKEYDELLGQRLEVTAVLIKDSGKQRNIDPAIFVTSQFEELLSQTDFDVAVEAIVGVEPAYTFVSRLLQKSIPVITANKEMMAYKGKHLHQLAKEHRTECGFEAAVAGGIPVIRLLQSLLHANRVEKIEGILNGTSNFILTCMRGQKLTFPDALRLAQEKGYAESDPTNDTEGFDAFYKLMILSEMVFDRQPEWGRVWREGISQITQEQLEHADAQGKRIKLIASVERSPQGDLVAKVKPEVVSQDHPLYAVEGVDNAVNIKTDLLGDLLLKGQGAGALPTASAVLEDLVSIFRKGLIKPYVSGKDVLTISNKVKSLS